MGSSGSNGVIAEMRGYHSTSVVRCWDGIRRNRSASRMRGKSLALLPCDLYGSDRSLCQ